jgi:hypothetical protein
MNVSVAKERKTFGIFPSTASDISNSEVTWSKKEEGDMVIYRTCWKGGLPTKIQTGPALIDQLYIQQS